MLARNSVQFHVPTGIQNAEKPAVHRLNQLVSPGDGSNTPSAIAIERKTRFLKDVDPLDLFLVLPLGDPSESEAR